MIDVINCIILLICHEKIRKIISFELIRIDKYNIFSYANHQNPKVLDKKPFQELFLINLLNIAGFLYLFLNNYDQLRDIVQRIEYIVDERRN